jgi:hypothetical protein
MENTNPTQHEDDEGADTGVGRPGDLLVGRRAIQQFLEHLGMPKNVDVYNLRRAGRWPIGKTSSDGGGSLVASRRKLARYAEKITRGNTAA